MAREIYTKHRIIVTSDAGPATPDGEPRMRIEIGIDSPSGLARLTLAQFRALVHEWAHILEDVYDG